MSYGPQRPNAPTKPATSLDRDTPKFLGKVDSNLRKSDLYSHKKTGGTCVNLQPKGLTVHNYILQTEDGTRPSVDWLEENGYLARKVTLNCHEFARRKGRYAVLPPMTHSFASSQTPARASTPLGAGDPSQLTAASGSKPSLSTSRAVQASNTSNTSQTGRQQVLPLKTSAPNSLVDTVSVTIMTSVIQPYKRKNGWCTKITTRVDKKGHGNAYHLVRERGVGLTAREVEAYYGSTVQAECHQEKIRNPGSRPYWYNYAIVRKLPAQRRVLEFAGVGLTHPSLRKMPSLPNLPTTDTAQITRGLRAQLMGQQVRQSDGNPVSRDSVAQPHMPTPMRPKAPILGSSRGVSPSPQDRLTPDPSIWQTAARKTSPPPEYHLPGLSPDIQSTAPKLRSITPRPSRFFPVGGQ